MSLLPSSYSNNRVGTVRSSIYSDLLLVPFLSESIQPLSEGRRGVGVHLARSFIAIQRSLCCGRTKGLLQQVYRLWAQTKILLNKINHFFL